VAPVVLDNMKMVRNFVQIIRSGKVGRKSLGSGPKKAIRRVFAKMTDDQIFLQSIGNTPSIVDVIKLAHIRAGTPARDNLFKYLMGFNTYQLEALTPLVQSYEAFKKDQSLPVPAVDFQMLSALSLSDKNWIEIGKQMNWHTLRMNLNTLVRHNCMADKQLVKSICEKIADRQVIQKVKVFPYQLFATYLNTTNTQGMPQSVVSAVQDALDISVDNVPVLDVDKLFICIDVSGSMSSAVTGNRGTATTNVRCADAAAIFAAGFAKTNKNSEVHVIAFDTNAQEIKINTRDSMVTIAKSLNTPGGGTDCGVAMHYILNNYKHNKTDRVAIIYISDNMSWVDYRRGVPNYYGYRNAPNSTGVANGFTKLSQKVRNSKLVLIDIQPGTSTQAQTDKNVLNVGGFSDAVFDVVQKFINTNTDWASTIDAVQLPTAGPVNIAIPKNQNVENTTDYWEDAS